VSSAGGVGSGGSRGNNSGTNTPGASGAPGGNSSIQSGGIQSGQSGGSPPQSGNAGGLQANIADQVAKVANNIMGGNDTQSTGGSGTNVQNIAGNANGQTAHSANNNGTAGGTGNAGNTGDVQSAGADGEAGADGAVGSDGDKKRKKRTRDLIRTEEDESSLTDKLSDYLVPLIGVMVFGLLIAFVYVPFGTEAMDTRDEIKTLDKQIDWYDNKISTLNSINLNQLNNDINTVEKVVRDEMDVSEMAAQVEEIALYNNLSPSELSFTNKNVQATFKTDSRSERDLAWIPDYTDSISGPFAFYGEFDDITSFLNDLRNESPTALFIDAVNVSKYRSAQKQEEAVEAVEDQLWSVEINIFGYTCPPAKSVKIKDPLEIGGYDDAMKEINERIERKEEREKLLRDTNDSNSGGNNSEEDSSDNSDNVSNDNTDNN
jgi:hypothetical protein